MSILIFLGVLILLVVVHEFGHFAVAKWVGMRVDEFGIGFPPKLFGIKKGETEYTVNALPLGGFVKIVGENNEDEASSDPRAFSAKSKKAQSAVLVAGITMNVLFAWLLVTIAFTIGVQSAVTEDDASENARLTVTNILPNSPGAEAGLISGATVLSVSRGDVKMEGTSPESFSAFVTESGEAPITIMYAVGEEIRIAQMTPKKGVIESDMERPAVGVGLALIDTVRRNIFVSAYDAIIYTGIGLRDITLGLFSLIYDAVRFKADLSQVAGPVGIVGLVGEASQHGITALLMFTAFISLNLAVINALPFPALDGGRLLFVGIEAVRGKAIPAQVAGVLNLAGFAILILLMVAVTWNDILRLV
jgi:regulator of sigma E protease